MQLDLDFKVLITFFWTHFVAAHSSLSCPFDLTDKSGSNIKKTAPIQIAHTFWWKKSNLMFFLFCCCSFWIIWFLVAKTLSRIKYCFTFRRHTSTANSISKVSSIACTCETAHGVCTVGIGVTVVAICGAFVNVNACLADLLVTADTIAHVGARGVATIAVCNTGKQRWVLTFIYICVGWVETFIRNAKWNKSNI